MHYPDSSIVLTLSPDNPTNTSITDLAGDVLYSVVTDHARKATFTQVRGADDEVLGSLEWRDVLADRVRVGSGDAMSLWDWMKKSPVPFKDQAVFTDDKGRKYKWKGLSPGVSLQLFTADDNYTAPIAKFQRSRTLNSLPRLHTDAAGSVLSFSPTLAGPDSDTHSLASTLVDAETRSLASTIIGTPAALRPWSSSQGTKQRLPATLTLASRAMEIQDLVVLSFLFLEKYHRTRESGSTTTAAGMYRAGC